MPHLSITEAIAAITGLLGVWLTTRQNILCWPVSLISIVTSLLVFYSTKLYQDAILQIFYFVLTLYGWYNWQYGKTEENKLKVTHITLNTAILYIAVSLVLINSSTFYFYRYTDASLPFWDSISLVYGIIGTIWMAKKWLQHWIIWIIVDLLCTGIYIYKGLYFFSIQFFIFTLLAIYGYITWKKELKTI